jgi:RNA polymerase sigma-70 factor (ECF subfamily)
MAAMTDERALLERARAGDDAAFDGLVRAHYARVHAVAFRLVGNHEDAEDLTQDAFVRAHRGLAWYRGDAPFSAWLLRIVVHLARDRFRQRGRRPHEGALVPDVAGPEGAGPAAELDDRELRRVVADAIARLPERLRTPLVLRVLEGLDYEDVAAATGVRVDTARTQVMKARRALAHLLAPFAPFGRGGER